MDNVEELNTALVAVAIVMAAAFMMPKSAVAQAAATLAASAAPARAAATDWTTPRTSWGHPDLQGVWSTATITPFERPSELAGKEFFTDEDARAFAEKTLKSLNMDRRDGAGTDADVARAYNHFWWDRGTALAPNRRTSLVIDPRDGRIPPLTPEAQARQAALADARKLRGPADDPEDRNLWERCIVRGVPTVMLPQVYNNNYRIVQAREYVAIVAEMIHDVRIIPLSGRPRLAPDVRQWMGDSQGRWDGETLVVETTNFTDKTSYRGTRGNLRLVERFTRTAADVLTYRVTIEDPSTFTRPWTVELAATKSEEAIYEYACHEANYGLTNILLGARAQEKEKEQGRR